VFAMRRVSEGSKVLKFLKFVRLRWQEQTQTIFRVGDSFGLAKTTSEGGVDEGGKSEVKSGGLVRRTKAEVEAETEVEGRPRLQD
jgi:hypothetical protein